MLTPLPDYAAARDRARASRAGTTLYPRFIVLNGTWCRQDYPGGPFEVLSPIEAAELLIEPREVLVRLGPGLVGEITKQNEAQTIKLIEGAR